jgi:hypothetical protein
MDQIQTALLVVALVAFVLYRQLQTRQISAERAYTLPAVMVVIGVVQGGIYDKVHPAVSVAILIAGVVSALGLGAVRATTMKVWRDERGAMWRRGTPLTLGAWVLSVAVRVGLIGIGYWAGMKTETGGLLLFLGLTLLAQNAVVAWRAQRLGGVGAVSVVS